VKHTENEPVQRVGGVYNTKWNVKFMGR